MSIFKISLFNAFILLNLYPFKNHDYLFAQDLALQCASPDLGIAENPVAFIRFEYGFKHKDIEIIIDSISLGKINDLNTVSGFDWTFYIFEISKLNDSNNCNRLLNPQGMVSHIVSQNTDTPFLNNSILKLRIKVNKRNCDFQFNLKDGHYFYVDLGRRNKIKIRQSLIIEPHE